MGYFVFAEELIIVKSLQLILSVVVLGLGTTTVAHSAPKTSGQTPKDFVSLADIAPTIKIDMKYAGSDNFTGRPVPGYEANKCLLTRPAAAALKRAQDWLSKFKIQLSVYDCYRPERAVAQFVKWAADLNDTSTKAIHYPKVAKENLFSDGYISDRSGHSRGSTVDIGLTDLDAGTPFDFFDPQSHTASPDPGQSQRATRALLSAALERVGFINYEKEWWHFTLSPEPHRNDYFDFPVR